jgi:hypothetical protein
VYKIFPVYILNNFKGDLMKRICLTALFLLSFILIQGCNDEPALEEEDLSEFNKLSWIKGIWEGTQGDAKLYESWRSKSFRSLEGISYTTVNKQRVFVQTMRIEQSGNKITLTITSGKGDEETTLDLTEVTDDTIIFTGASGSYPEKIIYSREGDNRMTVQLSGAPNADAGVQEFSYRRTGET